MKHKDVKTEDLSALLRRLRGMTHDCAAQDNRRARTPASLVKPAPA